jgi:thymidylate synthase
MRIYQTLYECTSETERNLWEMGIDVPIKTMQNKKVEGDPNLGMTKEIMGETYKIIDPLNIEGIIKAYNHMFKFDSKNLKISEEVNKNLHWVQEEFKERIFNPSKGNCDFINPGEAWEIRKETWEPFLVNGKFEYTYNERLRAFNQLQKVINHLKSDINSRRAVINIYIGPPFSGYFNDEDGICDGYEPGDLQGLKDIKRVPCSVTYSFLYRENKLHTFYHMRSSDFYLHWINDMHLAAKFGKYVADELKVDSGELIVYINSLHAYYGELKKRKIF